MNSVMKVSVCVVACAALMAACGSGGADSGIVPSAVLTTAPAATSGPTHSAPLPDKGLGDVKELESNELKTDGPEIVKWGGHDRQLAIIIRNQETREIRSGKALITVYDHDGRQIASSSGHTESKCCSVFGLQPGQEFGLFLNMANDISDVGKVAVRFVSLKTVPKTSKTPRLAVKDPSLILTKNDAIVTATVRATGKTGPYIAGQAFLTDRKGHLVGVISGRFYCFADGVSHRLRMQLLKRVPKGTRIEKVAAFSIPAGEPVGIHGSCT